MRAEAAGYCARISLSLSIGAANRTLQVEALIQPASSGQILASLTCNQVGQLSPRPKDPLASWARVAIRGFFPNPRY